jgi:hypothetical protein
MNKSELKQWRAYIRARVRVDPVTHCWEWQLSRTKTGGYGSSNGALPYGLSGKAHRLAYEVYKGPIPPGLQVRHKCHNRICCNPKHLLVGTHQDNKDDNKRAGRLHAKLVLTPVQVKEIKKLLAQGGYTRTRLGVLFNVNRATIGRIALGQTWR